MFTPRYMPETRADAQRPALRRGCYNGTMRLLPHRVPRRSPLIAMLAVVGSASCDSLPPPPSGSAAALAPTPSVGPAPSRNAAPDPAPTAKVVPAPRLAPGATASVMQVQVSGRVVLPRDAPAGPVLVALTDGPCFQLGTHYLTWTRAAASGGYLLETFPPVGTSLEACAAVMEPGRDRLSWWGRADRGAMPIEGRGRMVLSGTDIPLRRGPDVPLPVGLRLPD